MLLKQSFDDGAKVISDTARWIRPYFDTTKLDAVHDADLIQAATALHGSIEELKAAVKAFKDNGIGEELTRRAGVGSPKARSVPEFVLGIEAISGGGDTNAPEGSLAGDKSFESLPADNDESYNRRAVIVLEYPPLRDAISRAAEALNHSGG
jgi:hypothetical protein